MSKSSSSMVTRTSETGNIGKGANAVLFGGKEKGRVLITKAPKKITINQNEKNIHTI